VRLRPSIQPLTPDSGRFRLDFDQFQGRGLDPGIPCPMSP